MRKTSFARLRIVVSVAGLGIWLAAWLARQAGLGHQVYAVATVLGRVLLLTSACAAAGVWLYERARPVVRQRRYRALGTPGERGAHGPGLPLAVRAMTVTGSVGCAAVLVCHEPADLRAGHSACGQSGRPGLAITPDTRFEIGSVTKVFTGLVLADMVVRGQTELDATLGILIGLPARAGGLITLRSLATHTSGLPRLAPSLRMKTRALTADPDPYRDIGLAHVIAALTRNPPAAPGAFRYSNLGYQLLGAAVAAAAGTTWPDLIWQRIGRPLGLTATGIGPDRSTARGHDRAGLPVPYWDSALLPGAGALLSSPADLETFLRAQLDPASTELDAAIRLSRVSHTEGRAVRPVGLGWMLDRADGAKLAWHNGGTGGFSAILALTDRPRGPAGVAILVNSPHVSALDTVAREMLR
ncbi:MAG: beta-lactamase family protein [Actinomycetota bacterium]|nr:beta-lactamase family protein [Actinomycetota bacterium]